MKALCSLAAITLISAGSALAAPPPISWTSPTGSVLTLSGPANPSAPPPTTGTYLDNDGMGGCPKGKTYSLSGVAVSPTNITFQTPLCGSGELSFNGAIQQTPPAPGASAIPMNVSLTFAAKSQTWSVPPIAPPGPPCPPGMPQDVCQQMMNNPPN